MYYASTDFMTPGLRNADLKYIGGIHSKFVEYQT